jgi:hypothetical protein
MDRSIDRSIHQKSMGWWASKVMLAGRQALQLSRMNALREKETWPFPKFNFQFQSYSCNVAKKLIMHEKATHHLCV